MQDVATQRAEALTRANAVRSRNARLKRQLKSGELTLRQALDEPEMQSWAVGDVVGFACIGGTRWGGERIPQPASRQALQLLAGVPVSHSRPLRMLTERERNALLGKADQLTASRLKHRLLRLGQRANKQRAV
jgi:hypothetical protein